VGLINSDKKMKVLAFLCSTINVCPWLGFPLPKIAFYDGVIGFVGRKAICKKINSEADKNRFH
jgi:hypothetical protein